MNAQDALKLQYQFFYLTAKSNLDGMTAEHSLAQPSPGGNCANWILGHMLGAHNGVMGLANEAPAWESEDLSRAGNDPITSADQAIDWDTMVNKLLSTEERLMSALDSLTDEQLDEGGFNDPFGNPITRGQFLNLMAVHQNYHAGQLAMARRIAGLPGAIRAPQPEGAEA